MKFSTIFKNIALGIHKSIQRFPMTLLFSSSVAIMLIIIGELSPSISQSFEETLIRITMALALGIPLTLCAKVYYEREHKKPPFYLYFYYLIAIIIPILYFYTLLRDLDLVSTTRYLGVSVAFYLSFIFTPYLFNKKKDFESYVIHLFMSFLITYIYSGVLYFGLSAILFTIDRLLGITVEGEIYYYTFLIVALIFAPAYFLSQVPSKNQEFSLEGYSKALKILLLYIVMPLLSVYTFILYIYFVKILVTSQWPQGLVSHLVLWYSIILTIVLFFIYPLNKTNPWSKTFSKAAPRIVLPILLMMFVSIGIRINAYGVTENRYYVVVLGLWIFSMMLYYSIAKAKKNILLFITLSIVIMVSVLGPISSYALSKYSQRGRLETVLENNAMLQDGKIKPTDTIAKEDQQSISSILSYFNNNHNLKDINYLPKDFDLKDMKDVFGFNYVSPDHYPGEEYFYLTNRMNELFLDVSQYDYLIDYNIFGGQKPRNDLIHIDFMKNTNIVSIDYKEREVYKKDLTPIFKDFYGKYDPQRQDTMDPLDMTYADENTHVKVQFVFMNIGAEKESTSKDFKVNDLYLYVLIKIK